jgi:hypothetical protein
MDRVHKARDSERQLSLAARVHVRLVSWRLSLPRIVSSRAASPPLREDEVGNTRRCNEGTAETKCAGCWMKGVGDGVYSRRFYNNHHANNS